ncbi:MAG: aminopeptidase P N-terminal domain-containing protein, partial [Daejeonella sp.]
MKYAPIDPALFILNRKNFIKELKPKSIALFNANDEFPRSGDQSYIFKQNADLFYLSGIDQEQSILLLFPDCPNPLYKEVLFLRQTSELIAVWEGHKYTMDEALKASGIQSVYWLHDFWNILPGIIHYSERIYLNTNENDRYAHQVPYRDQRFIEEIRNRYPLHQYERSALILRDLRPLKSITEVE